MYVGLSEVFLFSPVSKILHLADSDRLGRYGMHPSYATEVDSEVYELSLFLS
jgi:hypothetical protein